MTLVRLLFRMAEAKTGYQPYHYDDPSANLWSTYLSKSEKYDKTMAQNWKGDMDAILIFAGLFSASVTAFIIESYKDLSPDPSETTVLLLAQISQQLASISLSNGSLPDPAKFTQQDNSFSPPTSALVCNALWFLSLGLSLICALSATLVEQWTRQYLQATNRKPAPQDRARLNTYLYQGIKKYKMAAVVETIPMLLHISLFLFFAGLVAFLIPVNSALEYLILTMLVVCCILYFLATILPIFRLACPYWTPLSTICWFLLQKLHLLHRRDADGNEVPILSPLLEAREYDAIEITPERDQRDLKAMCWTITALREDNEFEPFVEVIPSVVSGFDYSAKWLMDVLLNHEDISIKLGHRIPRLLTTCTTGLLDPGVAHKRAVTCLKSIWSLIMLSMPKPAPSQPNTFREKLKFKEDTFDLLFNVQKAVPSVEGHVLSVSIVIARSLLDMQMDRALALESELLTVLESGQPGCTVEKGLYITTPARNTLFQASLLKIKSMENDISKMKTLTSPEPYATMEAIAFHHTLAISLATNPDTLGGESQTDVRDILESIKAFQVIVNQASLNLALEYIGNILELDTLPHEAFNTLRRAFFRIKFKGQFTKESQERLVTYLEEAVEYSPDSSTRLPQSIIDILLSLTRVLTDPTLVLKAVGIIGNYVKQTSNEAAPTALATLERSLPRDAPVCVPLDLFSSHLYTDAKPNRKPNPSRTSTLSSTHTSNS